jgi:hypothetical protein
LRFVVGCIRIPLNNTGKAIENQLKLAWLKSAASNVAAEEVTAEGGDSGAEGEGEGLG